MPTLPRRRTTIVKRAEDSADESGLEETSTRLVENYPDLDADFELQLDEGPRDTFAQNARALFKKRMNES